MAVATRNAGLAGSLAVDGLLSGRSWGGPLSFGFPGAAGDYGASYGRGEPLDGFAPATPGIVAATRAILVGGGGSPLGVSQFTGLEPAEAGPGEGGDIRVARSGAPATAWAYLPGADEGGDVWLGTGHDYRAPLPGGFAYLTLLHELGHGLGLKHAHGADGPSGLAVPGAMDGLEFTVMSYRGAAGSGAAAAAAGWGFEPCGAPQSFMVLDIAALQHLYGADFGHNAGDTRYGWDPGTGAFHVDGRLQADAAGNRILQTVWDGGGRDVLDGGIGSNFLSGGAGGDVFFLDGRGGGTMTWSTVTDWQAGEQVSVWGWRPGVSTASWADGDGAEGFRGVTLHADLDANGATDTSVTWAGMARVQLPAPTEHDGLLWFAWEGWAPQYRTDAVRGLAPRTAATGGRPASGNIRGPATGDTEHPATPVVPTPRPGSCCRGGP